ncbi:MAG: MerR family transcriptional regulator [Candidatus Eremiobacteraeota bacterium]|nr:MerR family transcriptional regulator [Candidatus Eremiobacteraeota bacterium]
MKIQTVAKLTELSIDVLRAWERRYAAVAPERAGTGERLYTEQDVLRLRLLRDAVSQGNRISAVAKLGTQELEALTVASPNAQKINRAAVERMLGHIEAFDSVALAKDIDFLGASRSAVSFADDLIGPLFRQIGNWWEQRRLSVTQEHLASSVVTGILSAMTSRVDNPGGARILAATLSYEQHTIGAALAAYVAATSGRHAVFAGGGMSVPDLIQMCADLNVEGIAISAVMPDPRAIASLRLLSDALPKTRLWIGGVSAPAGTKWRQIFSMRQFSEELPLRMTSGR